MLIAALVFQNAAQQEKLSCTILRFCSDCSYIFLHSGHYQFAQCKATAKRRLITSSAPVHIRNNQLLHVVKYLIFCISTSFWALFPASLGWWAHQLGGGSVVFSVSSGILYYWTSLTHRLDLGISQSSLLRLHIFWCLQKPHYVLSCLRKKSRCFRTKPFSACGEQLWGLFPSFQCSQGVSNVFCLPSCYIYGDSGSIV